MTLASELLSNRARLTPGREALLDWQTGRRHTYAELNTRANQAANFLREQFGVQKGERVAILAHNSIAYVDLLFGLGKLGAIFAPLNWRLTGRELAFILNDSQPRGAAGWPRVRGSAGRTARPDQRGAYYCPRRGPHSGRRAV